MQRLNFLLPRRFRFAGILLFIAGLILAVSRFRFGLKPDMLDIKVFAVYSSYLGNKFLETMRNNMFEELIVFLLASGLFFIAFSREKEETGNISSIRLKAFFISAYSNFLFLLLSLFFTFGFAFIYMIIANMLVSLAVYIVAFRIMLRLDKLTTPE